MDNRIIYVVSDSVGETAELVVKASLSQFNGSADDTHIRRIPYVEDIGTINEVVSLAKADGGIICLRSLFLKCANTWLNKLKKRMCCITILSVRSSIKWNRLTV